jgi:hypothetical protein
MKIFRCFLVGMQGGKNPWRVVGGWWAALWFVGTAACGRFVWSVGEYVHTRMSLKRSSVIERPWLAWLFLSPMTTTAVASEPRLRDDKPNGSFPAPVMQGSGRDRVIKGNGFSNQVR